MTIQTVTGPIAVDEVRLADAHAHVWIEPPEGVAPEAALRLHDAEAIRAELNDFYSAGGTILIDCQPGGCGRNGNRLAELARATGVHITATTGFHQQKYYPPEHWLWSASAEEAASYFIEELTVGMRETGNTIRATTIKVGYEGVISGQTRILMEAAAEASRRTGALLLFHTERGKGVEALVPFFEDSGVSARRLYMCHVDKRADVGLHRELAQAGVLLGYDTFARPKYHPDRGVWPLLEILVAEGLEAQIAIGLDMALASMWRHFGGHPGLDFLPHHVVPRLRAMGIPEPAIRKLTATNIAQYLVWQTGELKDWT